MRSLTLASLAACDSDLEGVIVTARQFQHCLESSDSPRSLRRLYPEMVTG